MNSFAVRQTPFALTKSPGWRNSVRRPSARRLAECSKSLRDHSLPGSAASSTTKPIEQVGVGDFVWAWDDVSGLAVRRRVDRLFHRRGQPLFEVGIGIDEEGEHPQNIAATSEHPFWVRGKGWRPVHALLPGDVLQRLDSSNTAFVKEVTEASCKAEVFNFEVSGLHNYFVGRNGVLVHNASNLHRDATFASGGSLTSEELAPRQGGRLIGEMGQGLDMPDPTVMAFARDGLGGVFSNVRGDGVGTLRYAATAEPSSAKFDARNEATLARLRARRAPPSLDKAPSMLDMLKWPLVKLMRSPKIFLDFDGVLALNTESGYTGGNVREYFQGRKHNVPSDILERTLNKAGVETLNNLVNTQFPGEYKKPLIVIESDWRRDLTRDQIFTLLRRAGAADAAEMLHLDYRTDTEIIAKGAGVVDWLRRNHDADYGGPILIFDDAAHDIVPGHRLFNSYIPVDPSKGLNMASHWARIQEIIGQWRPRG